MDRHIILVIEKCSHLSTALRQRLKKDSEIISVRSVKNALKRLHSKKEKIRVVILGISKPDISRNIFNRILKNYFPDIIFIDLRDTFRDIFSLILKYKNKKCHRKSHQH